MLPQLHDWAVRQAEQSKWHAVGVHRRSLGIGYNSEVLAKKQLPEPHCWADLAQARISGRGADGESERVAGGYSTLATFVQVFGEDGRSSC